MMTISSPAGRRLAKAKASLDAFRASTKDSMGREMARVEFAQAAQAVADELMASGFHLMDGDD